jgi:type II secretory pathway predicted ATPase ExeA
MYERHFGLKEKPFELLPDPSFLYLSRGHTTALTLLRYSILSRQGFTVISGEVGSGKTTLINQLLDEIEDDITVGLINFTDTSFGELPEWVMMAFGLDYRNQSNVACYDDFVQFLIKQYAEGRRTVLIIDEAQNMGRPGLEKLRMLSNVNARKEYLLHLILVGQPELRDLLKHPEMRQLMQRISVSYHLGRLSATETQAYILHRIEIAGGSPGLFGPRSIKLITAASRGIPRVVNTLCDLVLVYAYSADMQAVDLDTVKAVLADRRQMGLYAVDGYQDTVAAQPKPALDVG